MIEKLKAFVSLPEYGDLQTLNTWILVHASMGYNTFLQDLRLNNFMISIFFSQNLSWRDLQHIIARSARFTEGRKPSDLVKNGAKLEGMENHFGILILKISSYNT